MPIMATHHQSNDASSNSSNSHVFYDTGMNDSPESPTSRKRKQEQLQYPSHPVMHHQLEYSSYYPSSSSSHQTEHQQQQWLLQQQQQHSSQNNDASSLVIHFNNQATMQASSDILPWHHSQQPPQQQQHSISTLMQSDFNISDPQQASAYGHHHTYLPTHSNEQSSAGLTHEERGGGGGGRHDATGSLHGAGDNGGVGENKGLSEIHQMLNLDQFGAAATTHTTPSSVQTPTPSTSSNYNFVDEPNGLHLADLGAGNLHQQRQLIQSWSTSACGGGTANAQHTSYSNNGSSTPGFFTPGFLESLQEDDNESYHTSDFPFHQPSQQQREWHASSSSSPHGTLENAMDHDAIMMPERTLVSQLKDTPLSSLFHSQGSTPSSPIPHRLPHATSTSTSTAAAAAAAAVAAGILSSSSISSTSSNASPPPPTAMPIPNQASSHDKSGTTINYFDDNARFIDQRRQHVLNARLLQHAVNEARMKPIIRNYLSNHYTEEERTVIILTSKVAQKSYGTEKRFLCPPPTAILVGKNWWTTPSQRLHRLEGNNNSNNNEILKMPNGNELCPPKIAVSISGEAATQSGQIEWYTVSGVTVGQTGHIKTQQTASPSTSTTSTSTGSTAEQPPLSGQPQQPQQQQHPSRFRSSAESRHNSIDWYQNHANELLAAGKCVSKHLYINDADEKRKRVEGLIRIQLANGIQMGALASKGIKVISKPSKKRQSVKNMELCIHHGTTVSLFNRIRSQTVSTKYLGVSSSSSFSFPGQPFQGGTPGEGTCFVARTTCWDPFVIWVVDTTRSPSDAKESDTPEDFIGRNAYTRNIPYPPPPAIALKNKTSQLIPIHYNQHVVLQCLTTGLVSPVMIIRKVDKASTVVGGAQSTDDLNLMGGGEYGDEVLGDPVSQLHKVALQIVQDPQQQQQQQQQQHQSPPKQADINYFAAVPPSATAPPQMPRTCHPVTYLACLNDMVGMHKTTDARKPIAVPAPKPNSASTSSSSHTSNLVHQWDDVDAMFDITSQEAGGKIVRKRRVSTDPSSSALDTAKLFDTSDIMHDPRRRVNSLNDDYSFYHNMPSMVAPPAIARSQQQHHHEISRKSSISSNGSTSTATGGPGGRRASVQNQGSNGLGAYWHEDVSDAAVWTIVGTDCATYTFLSPSEDVLQHDGGSDTMTTSCNNATTTSTAPAPAPFPSLIHMTSKSSLDNKEQIQLSLHGENFSRDLQVWFGDIKAANVEYRSRELMLCRVPSKHELLSAKHTYDQIPILLVRGDGTICKTNKIYHV